MTLLIEPIPAEPVTPLDWMEDAACATTNPDAFFPLIGESPRPGKKVCATCDVTDKCLAYALTNNEQHGTWGGMTNRELRKLRREMGLT